jgi:hypothetical protein
MSVNGTVLDGFEAVRDVFWRSSGQLANYEGAAPVSRKVPDSGRPVLELDARRDDDDGCDRSMRSLARHGAREGVVMVPQLLVAVDGSPDAQQALSHAIDLAESSTPCAARQ